MAEKQVIHANTRVPADVFANAEREATEKLENVRFG